MPFADGKENFRRLVGRHPNAIHVGHNYLSSDLQVLAGIGIEVNPARVEDTILRYWLANMHLCVSANTRIHMKDGSWKIIKTIKAGEHVRCLLNDGTVSSRKVLEVTRTPNRQIWYQVDVDGAHRRNQKGNKGVYVTADHEWITPNGRIQSNRLTPGQPIYLPQCGDVDFLFGTILGDGYVAKNGTLTITHTNRGWSHAKAEHLNRPLKTRTVNGFGLEKKGWYVHCLLPSWWRQAFYRGGIKRWVNPPSMRSLAVLYGDDGNLSRHKPGLRIKKNNEISEYGYCYTAKFSLHNFEKLDRNRIVTYFSENFGARVSFSRGILSLGVEESKKFFLAIAPFLHPSVDYKLPPKYRGRYNNWLSIKKPLIGCVISSKSVTPPIHTRSNKEMCLVVEEAENFFTRCGLVSNCKTTKRSNDEEGERRGAGYMNLWTMLSQYTDLWNYKDCRGDACEGPCPDHDVFGYNGLDALGPLLAMPKLLQQSQLLGVDKLYPLHRKLAIVLYEMRKTGVLVDREYVKTLHENFAKGKSILYDKESEDGKLPFNPDSPKQVIAWFKERGINLKDTREETIKKLLAKHGVEEGDGPAGGGIEQDECSEVAEALQSLGDWKAQGDGPDRWFAPCVWNSKKNEWEGYVDEDGFVHPRLGFYTSSGRMQCSNPNMQNVPARRRDPVTGLKMKVVVRKAIIAPPGYYLLKADYSNGENRIMLHLAGYDIPVGVDLHDWVRKIAGIREDSEFAKSLGGARDAAKSIQHAGNYLEGLSLLWPHELREARIQREISAGARLVYEDWKFQDKIVTFTGTNLAKRAFGDASWGNRRKALAIAEQYFGTFPQVRDLQRAILRQAETENMVRPPNGYTTRSYGYSEERAKTACAIWGSQPLSHFTKLAILNLWQVREKVRPVLQIHDELLTWVPDRFSPKYAAKLLREAMEVDVSEIPGLRIPADPSHGRNWGVMQKVA